MAIKREGWVPVGLRSNWRGWQRTMLAAQHSQFFQNPAL
jgi:hypothetical protein